MLSMFLLSFDFSVTNTENIDILSCLLNKACPQHSHNAIFDRDFRIYSVKTLQTSVTEDAGEFQNHASWDTL